MSEPKNYRFAESNEILKRKAALDRLIEVMCPPDARPIFTSDEATIFEVSYDMPEEIIAKLQEA